MQMPRCEWNHITTTVPYSILPSVGYVMFFERWPKRLTEWASRQQTSKRKKKLLFFPVRLFRYYYSSSREMLRMNGKVSECIHRRHCKAYRPLDRASFRSITTRLRRVISNRRVILHLHMYAFFFFSATCFFFIFQQQNIRNTQENSDLDVHERVLKK